jgi:DNA-binding transcriptional regulator YdaS (Cro superfamily)
MRALLHTEFAALLVRIGVGQARFARLTGLSARQVNNWCRGRAAVPPWAAVLAVIVQQHSAEAISMLIEETDLAWHKTLGLTPNATADAVRLAMRRLALRYHPDRGGTASQITRINAAYVQAGTTAASGLPVEDKPPPRR